MKTTPGPDCSVCVHKKRNAIERMLVTPGVTYREITGKYGMSDSALERHKNGHMVAMVQAAMEAGALAEIERGKSTIEQLRELGGEMREFLSECRAEGDRKVAASMFGHLKGLLDLQAKLLGELGPSTAVQVNTQLNVHSKRDLPAYVREEVVATDDLTGKRVAWVWEGGAESEDWSENVIEAADNLLAGGEQLERRGVLNDEARDVVAALRGVRR